MDLLKTRNWNLGIIYTVLGQLAGRSLNQREEYADYMRRGCLCFVLDCNLLIAAMTVTTDLLAGYRSKLDQDAENKSLAKNYKGEMFIIDVWLHILCCVSTQM